MAKIYFETSAKKTSNQVTIAARLRYVDKNGSVSRLRIPVGISVDADQWNQSAQSIVGNDDAQIALLEYKKRITAIVEALSAEDNVTKESITEALQATQGKSAKDITTNLAGLMEQHKTKITNNVSIADYLKQYAESAQAMNTGKRFHTIANAWMRFDPKKTIKATQLNPAHIEAFQNFLAEEKPSNVMQGQRRTAKRSSNSVASMINGFKIFCKGYFADVTGVVVDTKSAKVEHEEYNKEPIVLSVAEIEQIANYQPANEKEANVQRAFIFQCLTGLRVGDLKSLKGKVYKDDGMDIYSHQPQKTKNQKKGKLISIPLLPKAKECLTKGFKVPSEKTYNNHIRSLMKASGINREMTRIVNGETEVIKVADIVASHCARKSFIHNLQVSGAHSQVIASMSGHSIKQEFGAMAVYFKVENSQKMSALTNCFKAFAN